MTLTIPYVTVDEAQEYFDERLNTSAWDEANDDDKLKALKTATRAINNLRFSGIKTISTQSNEFPRNGSFDIPNAIKKATCELAYQLLDETDPNIEIESIAVVSDTYSNVRSGYIRDFALPHIMAGIPSTEAWQLLLPYLTDPLSIRLVRK